ncbi:MAG: hypothetical protein H0V70_23625 [Ktedonobacteraceae bacterium]|nr:hypothetical protein [Ktedonobacteraceae bacterium]
MRPGPRRYDANRLQQGLVSATAVIMPWLNRPQGDFDPIANGGLMIPHGWKDNGTILTALNNVPVKAGFREHILNYPGGWNADDWPLAPEQSLSETEFAIHSGAGSRQIFRTLMLVWYPARGVVTAWTGAELLVYIKLSDAQEKQIAALKAQLKTA